MKKSITLLMVAFLIGGAVTYSFFHYSQERHLQELLAKLVEVKEELSQTQSTLLGYTKYTDYISVTKSAISEQMKFLAAKVNRDYTHVEHIQKSTLGIQSDATIIVNYSVEYSFGFDLKPDNFTISGNSQGITVTLKRPELVASPSVKIISHQIPNGSIFINTQAAVIYLQQQLYPIAQSRARSIQSDEAVIALCEKKFGEFLRDFLAKQPNVKTVPAIKFAYK